MNHTVVQQVEKWYADHSEQVSLPDRRTSIRSIYPTDTALGKVEIKIEAPSMLASLTFSNAGSVSALAIDRQSKAERVLEDRQLGLEDCVPSLLDRYFREIIEPKSHDDSPT